MNNRPNSLLQLLYCWCSEIKGSEESKVSFPQFWKTVKHFFKLLINMKTANKEFGKRV